MSSRSLPAALHRPAAVTCIHLLVGPVLAIDRDELDLIPAAETRARALPKELPMRRPRSAP